MVSAALEQAMQTHPAFYFSHSIVKDGSSRRKNYFAEHQLVNNLDFECFTRMTYIGLSYTGLYQPFFLGGGGDSQNGG